MSDVECERDGCSQPAVVTVAYSDPDERVRYCGDCAEWAHTRFGDDVETITIDENDAASNTHPTLYGGP